MKKNYTINEIAEELNLSRNTVSKVVNHKSGVSKKTFDLVMNFLHEKEMVPKEGTISTVRGQTKGNVVFTYRFENSEYLNNILANIEETLKANGYALFLNIIRDDDSSDIQIPASLYDGSACGVISFNIFNRHYWKSIIELDIPSVFIDTFSKPPYFSNETDIISVENVGPVYFLTKRFVEKGKTSFGFVGDRFFCFSTYQRWRTLKETLEEYELELDEKQSISGEDEIFHSPNAYFHIKQSLENMEKVPEVFFCSSDLYAILILKALQELGYKIPNDVSVVGFDNWEEAVRQIPALSTVDAHPDYLGRLSVQKLIERIEDPSKPYEFVLSQTDVVLRGSTDL